jgi:hypothetical protein
MNERQEIVVESQAFETVTEAARHHGLKPVSVRHRMQRHGIGPEAAIRAMLARRAQKVVVDGKTYPHVRAATRAHGVDYDAVKARMRHHGESLAEAIESVKARGPKQAFMVNGQTFAHIADAARAHGVSVQMLRRNMHATGMSAQAAINYMTRPRAVVDGKDYGNAAAAAIAHGIKPYTVQARMRNGMTLEEAIRHAPVRRGSNAKAGGVRGSKPKPVTINGQTFDSIRAAAKHHGLDFASVYTKASRAGLTHEAAILYLKARRFSVGGQTFTSVKAAARAFELNCASVKWRMKTYGESPVEAIDHVRTHKPEPRYTVDGEPFASVSEAARANGLPPATVIARMKNYGEDVETAIRYKKAKRVVVEGQTYSNLKAASESHGVSYAAVRWRVQFCDESPEAAIRHLRSRSRMSV